MSYTMDLAFLDGLEALKLLKMQYKCLQFLATIFYVDRLENTFKLH